MSVACNGKAENQIHQYARQILKSESARGNAKLSNDLQFLFSKETSSGAIYLPNWICPNQDFSILKELLDDLEKHNGQMIQWSKHLKLENPQFSKVFNAIIHEMSVFFNVEVFASRLNFYPDGSSWKPYHHDSHAYLKVEGEECQVTMKEDFTMGASFGSSRKLAFKHSESNELFEFPQNNGDVFAFDAEVNSRFMHGVPKVKGDASKVGPRISIIAWGRRRRPGEDYSKFKKQYLLSQNEKVEEEKVKEMIGMDKVQSMFSSMLVSTDDSHSLRKKMSLKDKIKAKQESRTNKTAVQGGWANSIKK